MKGPDELTNGSMHDLENIQYISGEVVKSGWGEDVNGNLSLIPEGALQKTESIETFPSDDIDLGPLDGRTIWLTSAGARFDEMQTKPLQNIGLYIVDGKKGLSLISGTGPPTSEWRAHLLLHLRRRKTPLYILHCHLPWDFREPNNDELMSGDIDMIPDLPPGSMELAERTGDSGSETILWARHGVVVLGPDPETILSRMKGVASALEPVY